MTDFARSRIRTRTATFTRPNDTAAYTAGDVINNSTSAPLIMTFPAATLDNGGSTLLQSITLVDSANVTPKADLQLWLFDTTVVMDNDNAVFTPTDAELATLLQVIALPTGSFVIGDATGGAGGNAICNPQNLMLPITTAVADNAIYGILVVRNAYVPVAQEIFTLRLAFMD